MSKFKNMKLRYKIALLGATGATVVAGGGAALAYFTTTSSGPATAGVGTSSNVTLSGATATNLYPGGPAQHIAFTATNSSPGHQYVATVSASVTAVYAADNTTLIDNTGTGANKDLCDVGNFAPAAATADVGDIPNGATPVTVAAEQPTVSMTNAGLQNGCENAIVHLQLSSS
jgi:hypothetical protein